MNILIVDDEKEIADLIAYILCNEGYNTIVYNDPTDAVKLIKETDIVDLAILDIMMPKMSGFKLLEKIREKRKIPIIMLSAKSDDSDIVAGLTLGADDYIKKPFSPSELVARVNAQKRRYTEYSNESKEMSEQIMCGGILINHSKHTVEFHGQKVKMTPTEFDILWLLCRKAGQVVSSEEIFSKVWKETYFDSNNTVMVHIRRIREKLNNIQKDNNVITTVWGVGYKIEK